MKRDRIMLVDDEPAVRFGVRSFLEDNGFAVIEAPTCREAMESFRDSQPTAAIVDYKLEDGNALDLMPRLRDLDPTVPVIILTGYGSIDLAVRAVKEGAEHFLTKPIELPTLLVVLKRAIENRRNRQKELARTTQKTRSAVDPFVGASAAIRELAEQARRVADADSPILILGETGTGKTVLANWIHLHSSRCDEAFVDLNCAGLSRDLLEAELFGHERGAFTGAVSAKPGLLEVANRGTVFLDEIGDIDPGVQPKLLKVLEEKTFRRVGDVRDRRVDIRLIAATHQDLTKLVQTRQFRQDLFYRISAIPLIVPPLRARAEDVALLARQLLERIATHLGRVDVTLSDDGVRALETYSWPGNIRELRNVLERAVLLSKDQTIRCEDLNFAALGASERPVPFTDLTLDQLEREYIEYVLEATRWRIDVAARRLGIARSSLYNKIKRYELERPESELPVE